MKKFLMIIVLCMIAIGFISFLSSLFGIVKLPDIAQMYALSGITVGVIFFLMIIEYRTVSDDVRERLRSQYHNSVSRRAEKDERREYRRYQRSLRNKL